MRDLMVGLWLARLIGGVTYGYTERSIYGMGLWVVFCMTALVVLSIIYSSDQDPDSIPPEN